MSSRKSRPKGQEPSYEEAVAAVESIIDRIESGEMGLEEQIEEYARGAEMLKRCREILARCEQRVQEISLELERRDGNDAGEAGSDGET